MNFWFNIENRFKFEYILAIQLAFQGLAFPNAESFLGFNPSSTEIPWYRYTDKIHANENSWDLSFRTAGPNGRVTTLSISGNKVVAGGRLLGADNALSRSIAVWNGARWEALDTGVIGHVTGAIWHGDTIVAVGTSYEPVRMNQPEAWMWADRAWKRMPLDTGVQLTGLGSAGGGIWLGTSTGARRWDGSRWKTMGTGTEGEFRKFVFGWGSVWAVGKFQAPGDPEFRTLARWSGTGWEIAKVDRRGEAWSAEWCDTLLYVLEHTAKGHAVGTWDGHVWRGVTVEEKPPLGLAGDGKDIWLLVQTAFEPNRAELRKFNGQYFDPVATLSEFFRIYCVSAADGKAYIGGYFPGMQGIQADNLVVWDRGRFSPLSATSKPGISSVPRVMVAHPKGIFIAGAWKETTDIQVPLYAGGKKADPIAAWTGSDWVALGQDMMALDSGFIPPWSETPRVNAVAFEGDAVYAGGSFALESSGRPVNIARRDGDAWKPLVGDFQHEVNAILPVGTTVYFSSTNLITPDTGTDRKRESIWAWDGQSLIKPGGGLSGGIGRLFHYKNQVVAGGGIGMDPPRSYASLAALVDGKWEAIGDADSAISISLFHDGVVFDGHLYVLGYCTRSKPSPASNFNNVLMKWDGTNLDTIPELSRAYSFEAIAAGGGALYVAGDRNSKPPLEKRDIIMRFDGSRWVEISCDAIRGVKKMAVYGDYLYVAGYIGTNKGEMGSHLARWNIKTGVWTRESKPNFSRGQKKEAGVALFRQGKWVPITEEAANRFDVMGKRRGRP